MTASIEHIITFITVVEKGSFTAAADAMDVTKSVVSKHMSALETALGAQLLQRSTRKLTVTEVGQAFYEKVKSIPELVTTAQHELQSFADIPRGNLKVISPASFGSSLKIDVIPNFLKDNPEVTLNLELVPASEPHLGDEFDLLILGKFSNTSFPEYNLVIKKLFDMPVGIYATPRYLKKFGTPKTPHDLAEHNCLSSLGKTWPFKEKQGSIFSVKVNGNLRTKSDEIIQGVILKDQGIAYSYPFLFLEQLKNKSVVKLLEDYLHLFVEVYLAYPPTAYLPLKTQRFIDGIASYYKNMQAEILKRKLL